MAQHKAPTQVTVVTEEKSAFAAHMESKWPLYAIVALVACGGVLALQASKNSTVSGRQETWDALASSVSYFPGRGLAASSAEELEATLQDAEVQGTEAENAGKAVLVSTLVSSRDYDKALNVAGELRGSDWKPWTGIEYPIGPDGSKMNLATLVNERVAAQKEFESSLPTLFENPALPEGSPRVRMTTTAGDIVLGLYEDEAPQHVENFLKHVDDGFYVDTRFHRVMKDFMIQGGDPNSKTLDKIDEWGQGGPGYKVGPEFNDLSHLRGYLSAAKQPNDFQSSGSQFFITTGEPTYLDGQHCVFGVVLEGMDVVESIEQGETEAQNRPKDPVSVTGVTRL